MKLRFIIQKCTAILLLLVFVLSITPKRFLHDIIAQHKDTKIICHDDASKPHFHEVGFKCECDNFVADAPFSSIFYCELKPASQVFSLFNVEDKNFYRSVSFALASLRGPPEDLFVTA